MTWTRTGFLTGATMGGFATNALLCRYALGGHAIDAATYTAVRLVLGAATLAVLVWARRAGRGRLRGDWVSAAALFGYAAPFSFAYLRLGASTGSLLMCSAIQASMIGWSVREGAHPRFLEWLGLLAAAAGLVGLSFPGLSAADPLGAVLMAVAGVSWGVYSLRGRGVADPLGETAGNFVRALPMGAALLMAAVPLGVVTPPSPRGVALAAVSGVVGSGLAYTLWYAVVPSLGATRAAIVQLSMPVIAATGGVVLLGEPLTLRLALTGTAIIGGIAVAVASRGASRRVGTLRAPVPAYAAAPTPIPMLPRGSESSPGAAPRLRRPTW